MAKKSASSSKTAGRKKTGARKTSARKATGRKKTSARKGGAKRTRSASKRDLVKAPNASFYAKRDRQGQFKEMDEVGRSQKADRARKSTRKVKSGYGDRGDR